MFFKELWIFKYHFQNTGNLGKTLQKDVLFKSRQPVKI